jgi:predicted  nucleic acid-binding Zn-ribbon protein
MINNDCRCPGCGTCGAADEVERLREKAAAYERDWYDAKSEFGTATAKLRERLRDAERERDELKGRSYTSQGNYIEDAAGDRWWSADLLSRVERERNEARSEVEMLRGDREALNDVYRTMTRILSQKMAVERECDELKTRLAHAEADAEQAVHNEAFNERMKIVAWMRNRVVHKTNASMQTLDELVSICDAIHRGEHE